MSAAVPASAANEAPVPVIVKKAFVQKYFPNVNPLAQHFGEAEADPEKGDWATPGWVILGVVSDAKYDSLRNAIDPTMYVPSSGGNISFEVRTRTNATAMTASIRSVVLAVPERGDPSWDFTLKVWDLAKTIPGTPPKDVETGEC